MCHVAKLIILPRRAQFEDWWQLGEINQRCSSGFASGFQARGRLRARPGPRPAESGLRAADADSQGLASPAVELFTSLIIKTEGVSSCCLFPKRLGLEKS